MNAAISGGNLWLYSSFVEGTRHFADNNKHMKATCPEYIRPAKAGMSESKRLTPGQIMKQ